MDSVLPFDLPAERAIQCKNHLMQIGIVYQVHHDTYGPVLKRFRATESKRTPHDENFRRT